MKNKLITIFLLISAILSANSIFSFDGMPNRKYGNDLYSTGLGDAGINDLFRINTSYENPSMMVSANNVVYSTAISFGYQDYEDADGKTFRADGFYLPYFTAAVPIINHRIGIKYSLMASGNLDTYGESSLILEDETKLEYEEKNSIISNIYKIDFAYAFKNKFVNVGVSGNYYIGHRIHYWGADFEDATLIDSKYEKKELFKNPGFTIGLSKRLARFSLGLSYSSAVHLDGKSTFVYNHVPYEDILDEVDYLFEVPAKLTGGMALKFAESYKISADVHYELWEDTKTYDKNTFKLSAGISYDPLSGYGKWYESIPLRVGVSYRELPFEVNNEAINELKASFGLSLPLESPNKKIDLAVEYITRGDNELNGLSENSIMFSVGITGFDIFSKRYKKIEEKDIPKADF